MSDDEQVPVLNLTAVRAHLQRYAGVPGYINIWSAPAKLSYSFATDPDGLAAAAEQVRDLDVQGEHSIYLRGTTVVRPMKRNHREPDGRIVNERGLDSDTSHWIGLQADIDFGKPGYAPGVQEAVAAILGARVPEPSELIASGHGVYPVLLFDQPVPDGPEVRQLAVDFAAELRNAFELAGYKLDPGLGKDPARVWRIPGTVNRRPDHDQPVACAAISPEPYTVYPFAELRARIPVAARTSLAAAVLDEDEGGLVNAGLTGRFVDPEATSFVERFAWEPLRTAEHGRNVNDRLNTTALVVGHFVQDWFGGDADRAFDRIAQVYLSEVGARYGWTSLNATDRATIESGLTRGMEEPYHRVTPEDAIAPAPEGSELAETVLEREIAARERTLMVDREARRRIAQREDARRPRISDGLIDVRDLHKIEPPKMLMDGLIPADSVGFLAGKSGSYKSFLAVSWGCHLAAGRAWLGRVDFAVPERVRVLYVAAEGAAGIAQRIQAWELANNTELPAGSLVVYPRPIKLNSELVAEELHTLVGAEGFGMVIVDTYHRAAGGGDENKEQDFAVVFEAVARLRDDFGCSTLFLDHTGHGGGRPRGTSAKIDDSDYVVVTDYEGMLRTRSVQRLLSVFKLKDQDVTGEWPIRLADVSEIGPKGSAVIEIGEVEGGVSSLPLTPRWHDIDAVHVPAEIINLNGKGREAARDVFRVLSYVDEMDGLTTAQIRAALKEHVAVEYSDSVYFAGLSMLKKKNVVLPGSTPSRHILAPRFEPPRAD